MKKTLEELKINDAIEKVKNKWESLKKTVCEDEAAKVSVQESIKAIGIKFMVLVKELRKVQKAKAKVESKN